MIIPLHMTRTRPAYVHQKELFFSRLTVREHLTFHAINRICCFMSKEECQERVEEVMREVDLTRVADTQIGGGELYVTKGAVVVGVAYRAYRVVRF